MEADRFSVETCSHQLTDEREEALVVEQIKYLQSELCSIQSSFLAIISVSLGAYGLIIYYALSQDVAWLFILLPFLFSLSFYNILKYTAKMMGLDAYVSYLESLVNVAHQKTLFRWQSYLIYANGFSFGGTVLQLPCYFAILVFIIYKFVTSMETLGLSPLLAAIIWFLFAAQIVGLLCMCFLTMTQYGCVKELCGKIPLTFEGEQPDVFHTERPLALEKLRTRYRKAYIKKHGEPPPPSYLGKLYVNIKRALNLLEDDADDSPRHPRK